MIYSDKLATYLFAGLQQSFDLPGEHRQQNLPTFWIQKQLTVHNFIHRHHLLLGQPSRYDVLQKITQHMAVQSNVRETKL